MAERRTFDASDHVRHDWKGEDCIYFLEMRAHGYDGLLREILCTSAALLSRSAVMLNDAVDELAACEAKLVTLESAPDELTATPVVSKRNQQPGRLSGGEREALKKFMLLAQASDHSTHDQEKVLTEGRAMLAKVRKRALGDDASEDGS